MFGWLSGGGVGGSSALRVAARDFETTFLTPLLPFVEFTWFALLRRLDARVLFMRTEPPMRSAGLQVVGERGVPRGARWFVAKLIATNEARTTFDDHSPTRRRQGRDDDVDGVSRMYVGCVPWRTARKRTDANTGREDNRKSNNSVDLHKNLPGHAPANV